MPHHRVGCFNGACCGRAALLVLLEVSRLTLADENTAAKKPNGEMPPTVLKELRSAGKQEEIESAKHASRMDKTVQELAASVKKSVVVITFRGRDGEVRGLGAGFVFDPAGLIATNLHVIGEARPISVELSDGRKFDVEAVHATERSQDLAILKINALDLPALTLGNSDELQEGQTVVAIGNPDGLERSVVSGVLSGRREIDGRMMLQVALPIERGNSGGPLLDLQGRVHGLLTLKSLRTANLGFAVPINGLRPLIEKPNPIPMSRWLTIGVLDSDEWTVLPGARWRQRSGRVFVSGPGGGFGGRSLCLSTLDVPEGSFELAVRVKYEPIDGAAGLVFHADGKDRHYGFYPSNGGVRLSRFDGPDVYAWKVLREVRPKNLNKTGWNALKVRVDKDRMQCFLNDELVIEANDDEYKSGRIGLCKFRHTDAEFKDFQVGVTIEASKPSSEATDRVAKVVDQLRSGSSTDATRDALLSEGSSGIELLEQQAAKLEQQAARVRRLAGDVQLRQTLVEFEKVVSELEDQKFDLFRAGLLISKLDNHELDIDAYLHEVERHARRAKSGLAKEASEAERFSALNRYLFEEQGFHGSRTDYDSKSNSYLNEVLDDREGLPITLSILYMEVAKRMGLRIVGVGMPRHFLARHEPIDGEKQLVDVFERGHLISKEEAKVKYESLSDTPWKETYLDTSSPREMLERMLRNLFSNANSSEDAERMLRYVDALLILKPESGREHFFRAVICYQTQRWSQATKELEWLHSHDNDVSQESLDDLARAIARDSQE